MLHIVIYRCNLLLSGFAPDSFYFDGLVECKSLIDRRLMMLRWVKSSHPYGGKSLTIRVLYFTAKIMKQ